VETSHPNGLSLCGDPEPILRRSAMTPDARDIAPAAGCRYVLALASDASAVAESPGVAVLGRLPEAVVVEADVQLAASLAEAGQFVTVYSSPADALRALALFDGPQT
jgi:hypothetical protein